LLALAISIATLLGVMLQAALVGYALWRMIIATREAAASRMRAEVAATNAAVHAAAAAETVTGMAANIQELTLNTNSLKDALSPRPRRQAILRARSEGLKLDGKRGIHEHFR